jgi:starvation-inducible outer membrane lipoprotein
VVHRGWAAKGALLCLALGGCVQAYVIPDPLYRQVDQKASFSRLKSEAEQLKGATVALGGVVVGAKRLEEGTQIEVIQLPLSDHDRPLGPLENSEGRFLVIDPEHRDPEALLYRGITVVGVVIGTKVETIEEFEFAYPCLSARFIHLWGSAPGPPAAAPDPASYPYYPYYPYFYLDLYHDWYGPPGYYHDHDDHGPGGRGFGSPSGETPSAPGPSSPGGGSGRRFN